MCRNVTLRSVLVYQGVCLRTQRVVTLGIVVAWTLFLVIKYTSEAIPLLHWHNLVMLRP